MKQSDKPGRVPAKKTKVQKPKKATVLKRVPEEQRPAQEAVIAKENSPEVSELLFEAMLFTETLEPGMSGPPVVILQRLLNVTDEDGYGAKTKRAVMAFQAGEPRISRMDGFCNPLTWQLLFAREIAKHD